MTDAALLYHSIDDVTTMDQTIQAKRICVLLCAYDILSLISRVLGALSIPFNNIYIIMNILCVLY